MMKIDKKVIVMMTDLLLVLVLFWVLSGLVGAWILHRRGVSGWLWASACVVSGPFALLVVLDQSWYGQDEPADEVSGNPAQEAELAELAEPAEDERLPISSPPDDPAVGLRLYGFRGLSDH